MFARSPIALICLALAIPTFAAEPRSKPTTRPARTTTTKPTVSLKYLKSTPEQNAAAIATARRYAQSVQDSLKVKFQELQTPHFLIFTDWPAGEHGFLKENLEGAYGVVSKAFDIPISENVFIGKLPVYMFSKQSDFKDYAKEFDEIYLPDGVAGYFAGHSDGAGHMAMWKPDYTGGRSKASEAVNQWAYTLTHEFTHAFVARYRSNRNVPTWLNEGIAEVIASGKFPRPGVRPYAARMATNIRSLDDVFDENGFKGAEAYPIMQTLVETLVSQNRSAFLPFFNSIKDGMDTEDALKQHYNLDYKTLESTWRRDLQRR